MQKFHIKIIQVMTLKHYIMYILSVL